MIEYNKQSWCEHCGDLPPFSPTYNDGGTNWCLDCSILDEEFRINFGDNMGYWEKESYKKQIDFYTKEIKRLQELLDGD